MPQKLIRNRNEKSIETNLSGKKQAALAAGFDLSKNITCQVTEFKHRDIKQNKSQRAYDQQEA